MMGKRWTRSGSSSEEVFRLSDFSKEDFLKMMTEGAETYSRAEIVTKM